MKRMVVNRPAKLTLCLGLAILSLSALAADRYYRYNKDGVTVMDSRIPPEYVKNGYEVVTKSGRVLQVVPPAPSEEEVEALEARQRREAELAEWDSYLLRRYSSVAEIEAARERKLADFEASMAILRGNAGGIEVQIESAQARAANLERSGRQIPQTLLDNLSSLEGELAKINQQIEQRQGEKQDLEERFAAEMDRFATIKPDS